MELSDVMEILGVAKTLAGVTGSAADAAEKVKELVSSQKGANSDELEEAIRRLSRELTAANVMNVQLSAGLKELSEELVRENEFQRDKSRYEMFQTSQGDIVFKLKEADANGQPIHFICPVCLQRDQLISFITGDGDYKRCQTNKEHFYEFSNTPI